MLSDSLRGMKEDADLAEEYAVDKQKAVERAIQQAEHAKITAERLRKTADDTEKARSANPIPGIAISYQRALEDSLRGMKEDADLAEEYAVDKQKAVERAIQQADRAKITAERLRKTADDTEKSRMELGSGDASTSVGITQKVVYDIEKEHRVGPGGDTL